MKWTTTEGRVQLWDEYWNLLHDSAVWAIPDDPFDASGWLNYRHMCDDGSIQCGELRPDGSVTPWDLPCDGT